MDIPEINIQTGSEIIASAGALNWGLQEAFQYNAVTELLGTGNEGVVYLAIGVAGAAALGDRLGLLDLGEV